MYANEEDLKRANRHVILTGISITVTIIFLICLNQILGILNQVYGDKLILWTFNFTSQKTLVNSPRILTEHIIHNDLYFPVGDRDIGLRKIAYFAGVLGYLLNIGILWNSVIGLSVKEVGKISWGAYVCSIAGAIVGLTFIVNIRTGYLLSFGLMLISFFVGIQMKSQIQNSIAEHEKMVADAVEAFDRENQERTDDDEVATPNLEEKGDSEADSSADEIQTETDLRNQSGEVESEDDTEKSADGTNEHEGEQPGEEPKTVNLAS